MMADVAFHVSSRCELCPERGIGTGTAVRSARSGDLRRARATRTGDATTMADPGGVYRLSERRSCHRESLPRKQHSRSNHSRHRSLTSCVSQLHDSVRPRGLGSGESMPLPAGEDGSSATRTPEEQIELRAAACAQRITGRGLPKTSRDVSPAPSQIASLWVDTSWVEFSVGACSSFHQS